MNGAFYIGAAGLHAQQKALEVVADNIANINTPAFKRSEVRFAELVAPPAEGREPGAAGLAGALGGVSADASPQVFSQGELKSTGQAMDIAINGDGFIELLGTGGQAVLWRGGGLEVNPDGYLAAANGMPLKSMISVPLDAGPLTIAADGKVSAVLAGATTAKELGQIEIVRPKDMADLTGLGGGLYQPISQGDLTSAAPGDDGSGVIVQGSLEASNVQLSDEMITLLLMQRAYGANAQVVQAGDQLMSIANNLKR